MSKNNNRKRVKKTAAVVEDLDVADDTSDFSSETEESDEVVKLKINQTVDDIAISKTPRASLPLPRLPDPEPTETSESDSEVNEY